MFFGVLLDFFWRFVGLSSSDTTLSSSTFGRFVIFATNSVDGVSLGEYPCDVGDAGEYAGDVGE